MAFSNEVARVMAEMGANTSADSITLRDVRESYGIARGHMFINARIARITDKASPWHRQRVQMAADCRRRATVLRKAANDFMRSLCA